MQEWLSLSEIKKLIGSLYSLMGLRKKADREAWQSKPRKAVGGGLEYRLTSLPNEIQHALKIKMSAEKIQALDSEPAGRLGAVEGTKLQIKEKAEKTFAKNLRLESMLKANGLENAAKMRMNAKLEIIRLWEEFEKNSTEGKTTTQHLFCCAYNIGQIDAPDLVKEALPTISQSSLMIWIKQARQEGITRLAGKYGNRKKAGIFYTNLQLNKYVLAMIAQFPHCCAKQVWRGICANRQRLEIESAP
ncbi:MAG: DNA-binding protein, partial [Candidatus Riflebacteria bacterium]|nr:DNA-binding protein [Candidatus Riflebacteria bacterium]